MRQWTYCIIERHHGLDLASEQRRAATRDRQAISGPPLMMRASVCPAIKDISIYGVRGARRWIRVGLTRATGTRESSPLAPWHWPAPSSWVSRVQVQWLLGFKVAPASCFRRV